MTATYTYFVTKRIIVTVEAENEAEALDFVAEDIVAGDYTQSFEEAEHSVELIGKEELK